MDTEFVRVAYMIVVLSMYVNIGVSLYAALAKPNLVKKIIALTILGDSVNTFIILVGYRFWRPGVFLQPPVLTNLRPTSEVIRQFLEKAVDPIPQALVLTAIVINLAVTVFLATVALHMYRHFGTVNMDVVGRLKRYEVRKEMA